MAAHALPSAAEVEALTTGIAELKTEADIVAVVSTGAASVLGSLSLYSVSRVVKSLPRPCRSARWAMDENDARKG